MFKLTIRKLCALVLLLKLLILLVFWLSLSFSILFIYRDQKRAVSVPKPCIHCLALMCIQTSLQISEFCDLT